MIAQYSWEIECVVRAIEAGGAGGDGGAGAGGGGKGASGNAPEDGKNGLDVDANEEQAALLVLDKVLPLRVAVGQKRVAGDPTTAPAASSEVMSDGDLLGLDHERALQEYYIAQHT